MASHLRHSLIGLKLIGLQLSVFCLAGALPLAASAQTSKTTLNATPTAAKSTPTIAPIAPPTPSSASIESLAAVVENMKLPLAQRVAAIVAIGRFGPDAGTAITVLKTSLNDRNNVEVRLRAAEALMAIGPKAKTATPDLLILLKEIGRASCRERVLNLV